MVRSWKEYFTFTKKERTGIYVLLALIAICITIPHFFKTATFSEEVRVEAMQIQKAPHEPTGKLVNRRPYYDYNRTAYDDVHYERKEEPVKGATLFPFDPNTLGAAGWKRLGINDRTARTIQHYLAKGGQFRNAGDLKKMYSLKKEDFDRLMPYIRIETQPAPNYSPDKPLAKYAKAPATIIDINQADTAAFISLPGIGSKLANRIVNFREKLGGFYSVQQIGETFGLPDSTFQLIQPRLQCQPPILQKININTADVNALKQHPYIRWNIANAIVQYRQQHGLFQSTEALLQIVLITPDLYQKIGPYITVE
ncbi:MULTISPECIES: helix-hairpin-helix domain-containing protein [Niastella]|uniref:Helix-hairpin-helix domain-containing protein n=1 Tax=Niastella soli TaxID=2821487 RepID=A0ABS3YR23_9BACT|nr:helix-hairpin-helix domain-containing protein [Niastella soli]MBO9200369.1 helix-hairpin-helix domain-containing protein [Niastella soli]